MILRRFLIVSDSFIFILMMERRNYFKSEFEIDSWVDLQII